MTRTYTLKKSQYEKFFEKIQRTMGCWIWKGGLTGQGYGMFRLNKESVPAHRASYTIHYGPFDESLICCHKCDNPSCVNPSHLFLGTQSDNIKDAVGKGRFRQAFGPKTDMLTEETVILIRSLFRKGMTCKLAEQFGVSKCTISKIINRKTWRHI